jgi:O-antigen/teichoic acid export membrane protein
MARALVISALANAVLAVGGAWWWGTAGLLAGLGAGAALQWVIFRSRLASECAAHGIAISYRDGWRERAIIVRFALPASLTGFIATVAAWTGSAVLARQPGGFDQLGLYTAASTMRSLILFLPLLLNRVSMSLLNHELGRGHAGRYRKLFLANLGMSTGLIVVGVAGVAVAGPWVMAAFGKSFATGYPVLLVLLLATAFEGVAQAPYQIIQSHARMWQSLWLVAVPRDVSIVLLAFALVPRYGAIGLAIAAAVGYGIALLAISLVAWRIGFDPD